VWKCGRGNFVEWLTDLYCLSLKAAAAAATTTKTTTKYKTYFTGEIMTCSTNCQYRRAATLYTIETWFLSGI